VTRHEYLAGFLSRVTAPGGQATTRSYQAFDTPTMDKVRGIAHPEGAFTDIVRDVFGKPVHVSRRNADWSTAVTAVTPTTPTRNLPPVRTGNRATLMGYDDAGNLAWSASGLPWGTPCEADGPRQRWWPADRRVPTTSAIA
jgi:hypothetical protein